MAKSAKEKMDAWELQGGYVAELRLMGWALKSLKNLQAFWAEENDKLKAEIAQFEGSSYHQGKYLAFQHFQKNVVEKSGWDGWTRQYKQKKIVTQMRYMVGAAVAMCYRKDKTNVLNPFLSEVEHSKQTK